uniref:Uncharacterized protein n=1 Tax=Anguilla anguilla TaxID=7936 RepID=A0A0E9RDV7_ANGAN
MVQLKLDLHNRSTVNTYVLKLPRHCLDFISVTVCTV